MLVGRERSPSLRDASMGQDHFFQVGRSGKVLLRQATSPYGRDHPYLCFLPTYAYGEEMVTIRNTLQVLQEDMIREGLVEMIAFFQGQTGFERDDR